MDANETTGSAPQPQSTGEPSTTPAPGSPKRTVAIVIILLLIVGVFWSYQAIYARLSVFEVDGKITQIDAAKRTASLEFKSPRDGTQREVNCEVPEDCELMIDGEPASVGEFRVGDKARVKARWDKKNKQVVPMSVRVDRTGGASSS